MVYFTSDLHFSHNKEFLYGPRGFNSEGEMNEAIIKNWNSIVAPEDDVYVLGDLMLSNNDKGLRCIKNLKGKLHIIRGNHDSDNRMELYRNCWNVVEISEGKFFRYGKYHFYLSHYPCLTSNLDTDKPLHARMINLCGHTHTQDKFADFDKGLIYHVELDAHNCYPVSIEQIIVDMKEECERRNNAL